MPVKKTTTQAAGAKKNVEQRSEQPGEQKKTPFQTVLDEMAAFRAKYKTVPVEAQEYGSDGQPRAKLSWLLEALDAIIGLRGAYWSVEYSHEEVIDAGGGEKLCSLKAVISKHISDTANNYVGVGYGSAMLVERVAANTYKKHLDAWDVAQEKALAAAARFFEIGMELEAPPEDPNPEPPAADPEPPPAKPVPEVANDSTKEKEKALAELRDAVKKFHYQNVIIKIVQYKYGTERVESLPPSLLRDLKENMVLYHQNWQEALKKEAAAHGNSKRKDT